MSNSAKRYVAKWEIDTTLKTDGVDQKYQDDAMAIASYVATYLGSR